MKILHGHVGSEVSVQVLDENATPRNPRGYEYVEHHGFFARHHDSSFAIEPDGTLHVYGDPTRPPHHSYGANAWRHVQDENGNGAFNTTLPHVVLHPRCGEPVDSGGVCVLSAGHGPHVHHTAVQPA